MMREKENFIPKTLVELLGQKIVPRQYWSVEFNNLEIDSRKISKGDIFVALRGRNHNGEAFIDDALRKGAAAILVDQKGSTTNSDEVNRPVFAVADLAATLPDLAAKSCGFPCARIKLLGVTGTNGKSSCVSYIAQILTKLGRKSATVGTLGFQSLKGAPETEIEFNTVETGVTTPDICSINRVLKLWVDEGTENVAMEVSSHGLDQNRVAGLDFYTAVFTNLTQDHLDYHGSMENYKAAKAKLFQFEGLKFAVLNIDDAFADELGRSIDSSTVQLSYGISKNSDIRASNIRYCQSGTNFLVTTNAGNYRVETDLLGRFNVYNVLAAIACVSTLGFSQEKIVEAVTALKPVEGRMQIIDNNIGIIVVIDYAHTPDALEQAILAVKSHCEGRLWTVFGCGGDRDKEKRPQMGEIADRLSDTVVLTSDNPRSENANKIIQDISLGIQSQTPIHEIADRRDAINFAIENAALRDAIIIAGKGHEEFQVVGDKKLPFSDNLVATKALEKRSAMGDRI